MPVYEVGQDGDVRFYAMQFIQGLGLDAVITELRQLLNRARSHSRIKAALSGRSNGTRKAHPRRGIDTPTIAEGVEVEVGAVLRSILSGRFDPGGRTPDQVGALDPTLAGARTEGLASSAGTEAHSGAADCGPASRGPAPIVRTRATQPAQDGSTRQHQPCRRPPRRRQPRRSCPEVPSSRRSSRVGGGSIAAWRSIGRQVAGGLAYAHARGIVHRDIKPSNLLLDTEGVVWIADFGLAKGEDEGLTQSGDILGTLRYMAPERFRGEGDARADVYALGLTLYELLTLHPGFDHSDRLRLIEQIKTEEPQKPRAVDARIPRDLETIVLKAIEKDPKARYQTAEAMGEDLGRFLADEPIRARQIGAAERYWRWARRNPVIAVLGGVLTAVLILATVSSVLAAVYFNQTARSERAARNEAELSRQAESSQRRRAEMERRRADVTLADMYTSRGLLAGDRTRSGRGRALVRRGRGSIGERRGSRPPGGQSFARPQLDAPGDRAGGGHVNLGPAPPTRIPTPGGSAARALRQR